MTDEQALDALWAEIDLVVPRYEQPKRGDITKEMMAARYHISIQSAEERMKKLVATGAWKTVTVKSGNGDRPRIVLRKVDAKTKAKR